jgi:hypothetical protein
MQNLLTHRQRFKGLNLISDILPGLAIFLVPFFSFLSPINLKQISTHLISNIAVSLLLIFLFLIVICFVISIVVSKLWGKEIKSLFLLCCFGFYLLFLYLPIRSYFFAGPSYIAVAATLGAMLTLWLTTIYLACKFDRIVKRLIVVFSILMLTNSIFPMVGYFYNEYLQEEPVDQKVEYPVKTIQHANRSERNIYYIILDGMKSVEEARRTGILDKKTVIPRIEGLGLRYIENSLSSYNITHLSLASIFSVDYHTRENSERYKDRYGFFPFSLWRDEIRIKKAPLLSYLEQANSSLLWVGNTWAICRAKQTFGPSLGQVNCITNGKFKENVFGLPIFYETTPFGTLNRLMGIEKDDALSRFQLYLQGFGVPKKPSFNFIHHLPPHEPFRFTKTCEQLDLFETDGIKGYRDNYLCALVRVEEFMKKINILDPEAIVVIQADHGWYATKDKLSISDLRTLREDPEYIKSFGRIFNAIKAPDSCFQKYGEPKTNVNTIRFVLNCAYGFELPFREDIHYQGFYETNPSKFGTVFEQKIY